MNAINFEMVEHDKKYPVKSFVTSISYSEYHWHYEYEWLAVIKGSIVINTTPQSFTMHKGDIILINSKTIHEIRHTQEDNICLILQFDPILFKNDEKDDVFYRFHFNSVIDDPPIRNPYQSYLRYAASIVLLSKNDAVKNSHRIRADIYAMIADLFDYTEVDTIMERSSGESDPQLLMRIIDYFKENPGDADAVEKIAREVGMSAKSLHRFLIKNIGISAKELQDSFQINKAKHLLKHTDRSMGYIIDTCGFGSERTFYRKFRSETGITPKEYREIKMNAGKQVEQKGYLDYEWLGVKRLLMEICGMG